MSNDNGKSESSDKTKDSNKDDNNLDNMINSLDDSNKSQDNSTSSTDEKSSNKTQSFDTQNDNVKEEGNNSEQINKSSNQNEKNTLSGLNNAEITYSNVNDEDIESYLILTFRCNNQEIDRLKDASYGDYDYNSSTFLLDEELTGDSSYIIFDNVFNKKDDYLNHTITVNTKDYYDYAFVPYSTIYSNSITLYKDRIYRLKEQTKSYNINYRNGNDHQIFDNDTYKEYVYDEYLSVPIQLHASLNKFLEDHNINIKDNKKYNMEKIKYIFNNEYSYTYKELGELPEGTDAISYFLNTSKKGYCIHFASSATLLYRMCGIPTRYVTGYLAEYTEEGVGYCKTPGHAWIEVFDDEKGWTYQEVTTDNVLDDAKKEEIEEEIKVEEPQEEIEEDVVETKETNDEVIDDKTIPTYILLLIIIGSLIIIFGISFIFIIKKYKKTLSIRQRMNSIYEILDEEKFVSSNVYFIMEKIRYSLYEATIDDEEVLLSRYYELLGNNKSLKDKLRRTYIKLRLNIIRKEMIFENFSEDFKLKCKSRFHNKR